MRPTSDHRLTASASPRRGCVEVRGEDVVPLLALHAEEPSLEAPALLTRTSSRERAAMNSYHALGRRRKSGRPTPSAPCDARRRQLPARRRARALK
jgi:hypothetical protein